MPKYGKLAVLPMLVSAVVAGTAGAQAAAQQCDVDENKGGLGMVVFALSAAQQPGIAQAEQTKQLQTAVKRMFPDDQKKVDADNAANPAGRAFTLGKIYMVYLTQPDMPVVTTRASLGFVTNPTGTANLAVGIDSAFKVVEEKAPQCAALTAAWRQQGGYVKLVQEAMNFANANKADSAEIVARQAITISPNGPYAHLVLGNVAAQRLQNMDAIKFYKDALAEADKDTIYKDVRRNILYTLGNFALEAGQMDTVPANQKVYFGEASAAFDALAKDPGDKYVEAANQGRTLVLRASGDTAGIKAACQPHLQNPSGFPFAALLQCGVTLGDVKDVANARKLFEAAVGLNPYHRDGLFNLALMQLQQGENRAAIATINRLVAVDPSNPDNVKLYVFGYGGLTRNLKDQQAELGKQANAAPAARKKALTDSVIKLDAVTKIMTDSALAWQAVAEKMTAKVTFNEFTPGPDKTTIGGTIQNLSESEKTYTLAVEFLDKDGNVVDTATGTIEKVQPKLGGTFQLSGTKPGIVAFRYKPLT